MEDRLICFVKVKIIKKLDSFDISKLQFETFYVTIFADFIQHHMLKTTTTTAIKNNIHKIHLFVQKWYYYQQNMAQNASH